MAFMPTMRKKKVFLIGRYPPPLGGVTVFIRRYSEFLRASGFDVEIFDFKKMSKIKRYLNYAKLIFWPFQATYHLSEFPGTILRLILFRFFQSEIIVFHHSKAWIEKLGEETPGLFKRFLNKVDECVFAGPHLKEFYCKYNFGLPIKTKIESAFYPPNLADESAILIGYEHEVLRFVGNHSPLIVANASRISFDNAIDVYGLDMCVELIGRLRERFGNIGLLFALSLVNDQEYYLKINEAIDRRGVRDNFCFMTGNHELWPLFKKADLMIRPTCSDGSSVSIAEALYFNCPVVASDVCPRQPHVVLFRNRNTTDLHLKCLSILKDK